MAYQPMTLGVWTPPATPSYPAAAGPEPADPTARWLRLVMIRETGATQSGEPDILNQLATGVSTRQGVVDWIRTWRDRPGNDGRGNFPALVAWAASQLAGDTELKMSAGGSSASTSTTGGSSFTMSPLAWLGIAAAAVALLGGRSRR